MKKEILKVENIHKNFGKLVVLQNVTFSVKEGEIFFLLGPSGSGKTTLLRILSGLCQPDKGKIFLEGEDITFLPPNKRNIGLVFQNYALWPHMSVEENISYGLVVRKLRKEIIKEKVEKILEKTQLTQFRDKFPSELSGGQQQRVAIARTLVVEPKILLLDEPMSNLDTKLKEQMRKEIKRIQEEMKITTIYVTHDQKEAFLLGDTIAILNFGEIVQIGSPSELTLHPANKFVADFIGNTEKI